MQTLTKALIGIFMITVVTVTTGFSSAPQHVRKETPAKAGQPWYGGKPRPPMTILAPAIAPVAPDSETEVVFTVTPDADCDRLSYQLRGIDGVKVLREMRRGKLDCVAGSPTEIRALVRVPAKTEGSVVLSVSFEKEGKAAATTRSIAVAATDAAQSEKIKKSAGQHKGASSVGEETYVIEPADSRKQ